jgi:hypothetical protein
MYTRRRFLVAGLVVAAGAACARPSSPSFASTGARQELMAVKDGPLPAYVRTPSAMQGYRAALAAPAAVQAARCYCGCDKLADPHRSLYDCFVTQRGTFADHGATCGICQTEAIDAANWFSQGVPLSSIGERIDAKYGTQGGH